MNAKITAAKVDAILDPNLVFFGALLCNLKFTEDTTCETAWTDGTTLGFNPAYIDTLTHAEIVGLLAHEVMHCAGGHPYRRDNREPKKWNVACDMAINPVLTECGLTLPQGALTCTSDLLGKSAEWIYDRLPDNPQGDDGNGKGNGQGNGPAGEVRDSPSPSDDSGDDNGDVQSESDWQEKARQAAVQAKQQGKLPAGLDRFSKVTAQAKVDWKSALRKFVQQNAKSDYTWAMPSSRYAAMDIYLPSLRSEDMPRIAVAVDTSGSMDDRALAAAKAEIESVIEDCMPSAVDVLYADASVARHDTFERGEPLVWSPAGFGGTDFRPVFEAIDNMDEKPVCLVYITDLCGSFPDVPSDIPTLWVTDNSYQAPFGETIQIG